MIRETVKRKQSGDFLQKCIGPTSLPATMHVELQNQFDILRIDARTDAPSPHRESQVHATDLENKRNKQTKKQKKLIKPEVYLSQIKQTIA